MELEHKMNSYREHIKCKSYCKNGDEAITTFMRYCFIVKLSMQNTISFRNCANFFNINQIIKIMSLQIVK